ncbi:MAG: efflux RND transporter periplasmic adaptor subunit [Verrucomicrobia bacterium]|nr:efflux RND transporter periplasmic adaptor subunit [Verrucomicrobiota bacterium]MCH8510024.1 efflux RND transporter periplasmic adaptor subunit [Kiritimatiellia bacterium]
MKRLPIHFLSLFFFMMSGWTHGAESVSFHGLVEPERDVLLSPAVAGRIAKLHHREGDRVEEGTLLMELDSKVEILEVERRKTVLEDKTELNAARQREALLKEELESTRALAERTGSVSREELNRKELEAVLAGLEVSRLEQAKIREEIELNIARERLALQKILAPFDGIIAQLPQDEGESVQPNQPVLRLVADDEANLMVNVPARIARRLTIGDPVRLRFHLEDEVEKTGKVDFVSPVVDPASGLRKVRLRFDNREEPRVEPGVSGEWLVSGDLHE